jgi:thiamine kinase-like enzyme
MTSSQLQTLCHELDFGAPAGEPTRVYGGLIHLMWRVQTIKNLYAVKEINVTLNDEIKKQLELTEQIAETYRDLGISVITSIKKNGIALNTIEGTSFIAYPWVEATSSPGTAVSAETAVQIADILSKLHLANIRIEDLAQAEYPFYTQNDLENIFAAANAQPDEFPASLFENVNRIIAINNRYIDVIPALQSVSVVSHGDLDQKNVIWDKNGKPYLIDWESARRLNPNQELINLALDWSGIITGTIDHAIFLKIIQTYSVNCAIDIEQVRPCLSGILGGWIGWLIHNVKKLTTEKSAIEKQAAFQQIQQTSRTIIYIDTHFDELAVLISSLNV